MTLEIRLATPDDAAQIRAIYAPVVRDTAISFEYEPPSVEEMRRRVESTLAKGYPWLVLDRSGEILGYAYGSVHRERAAYRWSVEVSVYIHAAWHRRGVGRALYTSLFEVLRLQGFQNAFAGATQPNPGSVRLHEAMGFREIGLFRRIGYKFGEWHDVRWWGLALGEPPAESPPPLSLDAARQLPGWRQALEAGLGRLQGMEPGDTLRT